MKQKFDYKTKVIILTSIIGALALLYAGSFIFTSERQNRKTSLYTWIDEKTAAGIDRIAIYTIDYEIEFNKKNSMWFILTDGNEYPARSLRIEDFISIFTANGLWPVRANNASSHSNFGLESGQANRISFYSGNTVLLDVLTGNENIFGNEITIRRYAQNEVRSGDNRIKTYISSSVSSWYNLRLFNNDDLGAEDVQKLTVFNNGETAVFSRINGNWEVSRSDGMNTAGIVLTNPDTAGIDSYIRIILNSEGDNFEGLLSKSQEPFSAQSRIVFEFGNGAITTVNFTEPDESNRRLAAVSGVDYIYQIPAWVSGRLFRNISEFEGSL